MQTHDGIRLQRAQLNSICVMYDWTGTGDNIRMLNTIS